MIEDLADEMRRLGEAARACRIPLGEELDLCRSHLSLMRRRLDRSLELDVEGVDTTEAVPPALFHTLIENGLTHNHLPAGTLRFALHSQPGLRHHLELRDGARVPVGRTRFKEIRDKLPGSPQD